MSLFKKIMSRNGNVHILKDGKAVKPTYELPAIIDNLEPGNEVEIGEAPKPKERKPRVVKPKAKTLEEQRVSVFSGEPGTRTKWLNDKSYWMTDEEYQNTNLGKLAQVVREKGL